MKVFALVFVVGCLTVQAFPAQEQKTSNAQKPQISTLPAKIGQPNHQTGSASSKPGTQTARVARQASTTEKPKDDQKVPHILIDSQDSKSRPVRDTQPSTTEKPDTQKAPHILASSNQQTKNSRPVRDTQTSTTEDPKEASAVAHLLQASQGASARQTRQAQDSSINSKSTDNKPSEGQRKPAISPAVLTKDVPRDSIKTAQH